MKDYYNYSLRGYLSSIIFTISPKNFLIRWGVQNWFKRDLFGNPKLL